MALALAAAALGFLIGYVAGGSRHASLRAHLATIREGVEALSGGLEVLEIHYEKAVKDGRVVSAGDYQGVTDNLDALQHLYDRLDGDLRALDAETARRLREDLERLKNFVTTRKSPSEVIAVSREIQDTVHQILPAGGK